MFVDFMQVYLDIELDFVFSDCVVDVVDEGFDVVLCIGQLVDLWLFMCELGEFQLKLVGLLVYFVCYGMLCCLEDLLWYICLYYCFFNIGCFEEWLLCCVDGEVLLQILVLMVCNNIEICVCFVLCDQGIVCLLDFLICEVLCEGCLVSVFDVFCECCV